MTEEAKTTLFYILVLAGLILSSILFTGRIESLVEERSAAPATPTLAKVNATLSLPEVDQKACLISSQKTAFYRVETSLLVNKSLVISGVVYASDFVTPIPDVLIEFWQANFSTPPHYILHTWARTDATGHYQTTILKLGQGNILPLYYRVRYQNRCPLALQLLLVDKRGLADPSLTSTLAKLGLAQGEPAGPLLQGPVDIVLPVSPPPPSPEASGSAAGIYPYKDMTLGPSYYASDPNLETERGQTELELMKQIDLKTLRDVAEGPVLSSIKAGVVD